MLSFIRFSFLASTMIFALAGHASADVILPTGLPAGTQYRIAFLTAGVRDAQSANIAYYNAFVAQEALASSSEFIRSLTWKAIVSTSDVSAIDNADLGSNAAVYNTNGQLVVPGGTGSGLLSVVHSAAILWDQNGALNENPYPWTGTSFGGTSTFPGYEAYGSYGLGNSNPYSSGQAIVGAAESLDLGAPGRVGWLQMEMAAFDTTLPIYAISGVITTVPEPSALTLLAAVIFFGTAVAIRRRAK